MLLLKLSGIQIKFINFRLDKRVERSNQEREISERTPLLIR